MPEWRKAWKLDDPAWVKNRQNEWRRIRQSPVLEWAFNKEQLKRIKNFFMTGSAFDPELPEEEWRMLNYHPDRRPLPVNYALLLRCWLAVDHTEDHWHYIKQISKPSEYEYYSTRDFMRKLLGENASSDGVFGGLDERLYLFFGPIRCRPEDYPELNQKQFLRVAWATNNQFRTLVKAYMSKEFNPANIAPTVLNEWCDSLLWTYEAIGPEGEGRDMHVKDAADIVSTAKSVIEKSEQYQESQVKFAEDLLSGVRSRPLPPAMATALKRFLS